MLRPCNAVPVMQYKMVRRQKQFDTADFLLVTANSQGTTALRLWHDSDSHAVHLMCIHFVIVFIWCGAQR